MEKINISDWRQCWRRRAVGQVQIFPNPRHPCPRHHDRHHHDHYFYYCPVAKTVASVTFGRSRLVRRLPPTLTTTTPFMVIDQYYRHGNVLI